MGNAMNRKITAQSNGSSKLSPLSNADDNTQSPFRQNIKQQPLDAVDEGNEKNKIQQIKNNVYGNNQKYKNIQNHKPIYHQNDKQKYIANDRQKYIPNDKPYGQNDRFDSIDEVTSNGLSESLYFENEWYDENDTLNGKRKKSSFFSSNGDIDKVPIKRRNPTSNSPASTMASTNNRSDDEDGD